MKTVYTIGLSSKTHKGEIKIRFTKRSYADRLAGFIGRIFHVRAWSIINNDYTDAEIAEIKAAFMKVQQRPLDQDNLKVWHWKE